MRISFNSKGFDELLTSAGAHALVTSHADDMAGRANAVPSTTAPAATEPYYEIEDGSDAHRARVRIVTASPRAAAHEAKTHALQRNL